MSNAAAVRVKVICPYCDFEQHAECAELEAHDTLERCLYCGTSFVCAFSVAVSFVVAAIEGRGPGAQARVAQHASRAKAAELAAWKPAKPPDGETTVLRDETVNRDAMPRIDESASIADNVKRRADAMRVLREELNPALFPSAAPAAEPLTSASSKEGASSATGAADSQIPRGGPVADASGTEPQGEQNASTSDPPRRIDPRSKLSEKQRDKLSDDYRRACPNGGKPPHGWLRDQSARYGAEYKTLYKALARMGLYPWTPAPAETDDARDAHELGAVAPAKKAHDAGEIVHTHSHACWCRKGPNNAANRWCSNAPERTQRVTLADPHATMGRPPQRGKPAY